MSLNIKNEATHAKVRMLAELTGVTMTAAVDAAVEKQLSELGADPLETKRATREAQADQIIARWREAGGEHWREELARREAALYDDEGLFV